MALQWESQPYSQKSWMSRLQDTVDDAKYHTRRGDKGDKWGYPMPGAVRKEHGTIGTGSYADVPCHGECVFRWGVNRSGGTISKSTIARRFANQAVTASGAGTVSTFVDAAQFTAYEEVGNILNINDDAGGAGAAPEGEWGVITTNDANTLYLQPSLTVATNTADTGVIVSVGKLDLLGGAIERWETFGVALADIADNYWGWFLCYGIVSAKVVAAAAVTVDIGLIGAAGGLLGDSSTSGQDIMLARAITDGKADIASDIISVFFDVYRSTPFTSA